MRVLCFAVYLFLPTIFGTVTFLIEHLFTVNGLFVLQAAIYSFFAFELLVAWMHQYLWHGPLWFMHKHHHETPSRVTLDENDWLGVGNGIWIMSATYYWQSCSRATSFYFLLGGYILGTISYGIIVLYIHDGLAHHRFPVVWTPFKRRLRMQAGLHLRHHHADRSGLCKKGVAPFGFVLANEELKSNGRALSRIVYAGAVLQLCLLFVPPST